MPFVGLDAPTSAAALIALGLHLLSGGIVLVLNGNCRREIEETLRKSKAEGVFWTRS